MTNRWIVISKMPTLFNNEKGQKCHESILRAHQILEEVKILLEARTNPDIILMAIGVMEVKTTEPTPEPPAETSADPLVDTSYTGQIAALRAENKKMREALVEIIAEHHKSDVSVGHEVDMYRIAVKALK